MDTWNPAPDQQEEIPWNYKNYGTVLDQSDDLNIKETINTREEADTSIPVSERDGLIAGGRNSESAGRQKSMQAQTDRQLELAASKMTKGEMWWRLGHLSLSPLLSLLSSFFPLSLCLILEKESVRRLTDRRTDGWTDRQTDNKWVTQCIIHNL